MDQEKTKDEVFIFVMLIILLAAGVPLSLFILAHAIQFYFMVVMGPSL